MAPLLVMLPLLAGRGQGSDGLGLVVAKATLGFGLVIVLGRFVFLKVFEVVAGTKSTNTFVATTLLVAVGMAVGLKLGRSSATGATDGIARSYTGR